MEKLRGELPVGIEFAQVSDQPAVVKQSVGEFMRALLEAVAIVLVVSFLSLGVRTGLVVALTIPLVLAGDLPRHVLVRHRPAPHLDRRADHRPGPAGRRRDDRGAR